MAEAILDAIGPVLTRWTMGGSAVAAAPTPWRDVLGGDAGEAELRLLALSGQFLGALALAEPTGEVRPLADIPALPRPPLPDTLRPRTRRLLQQLREPVGRRDLLDFLDARGWTLHPGDWMPTPNQEVPAIYAPWQDWAATSDVSPSAAGELTAESWDMLGPAARHAAFAALRRRDAAQAGALLAGKIGGEAPDLRVRLVEALSAGLSEADRPLLESLAADRAPRVKALATSLLARLGHGEEGGEDATELAAFFPVQSKGLLRRTRSIAPQELKTSAQRNRRNTLMETLPLSAFAQALALAPEELVAAWPWGRDRQADYALTAMVARSGSDANVGAATEALTTGASLDPDGLAPLLPRLTQAQRRQAASLVLRAKGGTFAQALAIAGGDGRIEDTMRTSAGATLLADLTAENARPADQAAELLALGLLASRAAARQALEQVAAAGLIASDPRLDMLRLNAALEDRRVGE